MKTITIEVKPIEEAKKDSSVLMTWWDGHAVYIGWKKDMNKKYIPQQQKWYLPYQPDKVEYVDEGEWYFVRFNTVNGQFHLDAPCGLFKPKEWSYLPNIERAVVTED